jgi:predicted hydrocarbon binding protein
MVLDLMRLIAMKIVKFDDGQITVYGRRMVLVPAETLVSFREILEKEMGVEGADAAMIRAGKDLTVKSTRRYVDKKKELRPVFQKLTTGDPSIEMGKEIFKMSGLGNISILEVTKDKYLVGTKNSPLANEYLLSRGKSATPVCSFLMGIVCGVLEGYRHEGYSAKELRCRATGTSDECIFEFRRTAHQSGLQSHSR